MRPGRGAARGRPAACTARAASSTRSISLKAVSGRSSTAEATVIFWKTSNCVSKSLDLVVQAAGCAPAPTSPASRPARSPATSRRTPRRCCCRCSARPRSRSRRRSPARESGHRRRRRTRRCPRGSCRPAGSGSPRSACTGRARSRRECRRHARPPGAPSRSIRYWPTVSTGEACLGFTLGQTVASRFQGRGARHQRTPCWFPGGAMSRTRLVLFQRGKGPMADGGTGLAYT